MTTKLPVSAGRYSIVGARGALLGGGPRSGDLRPDEAVLRSVSRSRIDERLAVLVASGRVAASAVVARYRELVDAAEGGGS
jgi:hypothetical protein